MTERLAQPIDLLFADGVSLACAHDGSLSAQDLHGLFAADTRLLSTYRLAVGGARWDLLSRAAARRDFRCWYFENPEVQEPHMGTLPQGVLMLRLERMLGETLRDDIHVVSHAEQRVHTTLGLQLDADFADIFEVKSREIPPRLGIERRPLEKGLLFRYEQEGFRRGLEISFETELCEPEFSGALVYFELVLEHGQEARIRLEAKPDVDDAPFSMHVGLIPDRDDPSIEADEFLAAPFETSLADLDELRIPQRDGRPLYAAGVPWFNTLFGRDSLVPCLMSGMIGDEAARGALEALARYQATERDDWRDAEPGKFPHELRRGELAHLDRIPHTPYYGTHDTPSLYCLTLWEAWRWTADRSLLDRHLDAARRGLRWALELGDRDGDGLQEYETRSRRGYENQGWKDAGDAILDPQGEEISYPRATVDLQGYLFAALLAMAELERTVGDDGEAARLVAEAGELRERVEQQFWIEEEGFYALALDGDKRRIDTITSNPGHLLWSGLPEPDRARLVGRRLLADDLAAGYGLRTLSSHHPRFDPLSYQRGSVWPHDTALAAAGLWRYGMREEAAVLLRGLFDAAEAFERYRLPELYGGFDREIGPPVPYREANAPQAWAAAVPVLATQLFLGIVPDAPSGVVWLDPWLPEWLPRLAVENVPFAGGRLRVVVEGRPDGVGRSAEVVEVDAPGVEVRVEQPPAGPLHARPVAVTAAARAA